MKEKKRLLDLFNHLFKNMDYPNFLCIGAHKAGTTWLQKTLETHPDVFLPMKEIHYFDRDVRYPSTTYLSEINPFLRLLKKENRTRNIQITRALVKSALTFNEDRFRFFAKFFLKIDEQWYPNLFVTRREYRIKGDITPSYSILKMEDIRKIKDMNPEIKIVFIMRNPIDRDWSACRYNITRHGHLVDSLDYFNREMMVLRGDYLRTINNYSGCFPENQIYYCFFDELIEEPDRFYDGICHFLGIPPLHEHIITEKINQSSDFEIDPAIQFYLASRHLPQLEKLADRFGGYCLNWYENAKNIVANSTY